jgi:hypothetical protein
MQIIVRILPTPSQNESLERLMNHFAMPFYIFKLLCLAELSYFRL